jgi:hypothetical protein
MNILALGSPGRFVDVPTKTGLKENACGVSKLKTSNSIMKSIAVLVLVIALFGAVNAAADRSFMFKRMNAAFSRRSDGFTLMANNPLQCDVCTAGTIFFRKKSKHFFDLVVYVCVPSFLDDARPF